MKDIRELLKDEVVGGITVRTPSGHKMLQLRKLVADQDENKPEAMLDWLGTVVSECTDLTEDEATAAVVATGLFASPLVKACMNKIGLGEERTEKEPRAANPSTSPKKPASPSKKS